MLCPVNIWPQYQLFCLRTWIFGPSQVKYDIFNPASPGPFQKISYWYIWYCQLLYLKCLANICFLVNIWPQDSNILPHDYLGTACQIWHIWSSLTLTITQINNLCCQFGLPPNFVKYLLFSANIWPRTQIFGYMAQIFGHSPVKYDIFDPAWPRPFQKYIIYIVNLLHFQIAHQYLPNIWFCGQYLAPGLKYLARWLKYFGPATSNMTYLIRPDLNLSKNISFMGSS